MRATAPGTILDASALTALPRSIYAQTIVEFSLRERRPLVVSATSLYVAALAGVDPADFDAFGWTVTPVSQSVVPGLVAVAESASGPVALDIAHVGWESQVTGYPVLTDNPGPYAALSVPVDLEII
ncbi:hypothetical protein [Nocardia testacea]|uniref:hypothetical protein n=1 Tax=Nocardia testacea TaxID=248551 RepID=UPI0033F2C370